MNDGTFTSESVSAGHPDKLCDQISDAVLDAALEDNPRARVACECLVKCMHDTAAGEEIAGDMRLVIAGEITPARPPGDYRALARRVMRGAGYTDARFGLDAGRCDITVWLGKQSADIAQGVDQADTGAGDQGMMFGYATDETENYMPAPIEYAHRLMRRHAELLRGGALEWLRPDAKAQLTFAYRDGRPAAVRQVVLSTQHAPEIGMDELRARVKKDIIAPTLPDEWTQSLDDQDYHINPTGAFVVGGPLGDCGLTGRKIIVDTYGGMARHGGGAFSGKDPTKVDRSGAYAARWVARHIVEGGLARRCEVRVSYAIGEAQPVDIGVETFGTARVDETRIARAVRDCFDLTPGGIIEALDLRRPIYAQTAVYGHFGRGELPWEQCGRLDELRRAAGL